MERLNVRPLFRGHWKSLTNRAMVPDGELHATADIPARSMTIAVPLAAGSGIAAVTTLRPWVFDITAAGLVIGIAALVIGGVLAAFGQLAAWRTQIAARDRDTEAPLRAMVDEAATHLLLAVFEAVLLVPTSMLALVLPAGPPSLIATVPLTMLCAHLVWLFILVTPRLYSAYGQVNEVAESIDGYSHTKG
ncbi:hypothetical protein HJ590_13340 [Naumannella sp. ID2617S]|nr:hypothetical protein [Naumannella sp. ID2617S]